MPGFVVPIPKVPNPEKESASVPTPIWNFWLGNVVPIPVLASSVMIKTDWNGSIGNFGSRVAPPTPTWNLPSGCVLPIPTRPAVDWDPHPFASDIAVKTVPARPTSNLFFTVKQSNVAEEPTMPPLRKILSTFIFAKVVVSENVIDDDSISAYNLPYM